jgi:hypothetical protein
MSSSDRLRTDASDALGATTPVSGAGNAGTAEPYSRWLERVQRSRTRQAAISMNLYTWSNYKSWADKVKHSFDDKDEKNEKK